MTTTHYLGANVDGLKISYREAGRTEAPTLLLLHGFPSAGHVFRDLIPLLADRYQLVAPDLPGFGQSEMPARDEFNYTFNNLAEQSCWCLRSNDREGNLKFLKCPPSKILEKSRKN
jgi:pimeloyl-ACP methyl ester carboxylesterase